MIEIMKSVRYVLGIDISTTASKALLLDDWGKVASVAAVSHEVSAPYPLWSEQDPESWWTAVGRSVQAVLRTAGVQPDAVGLTGQMHGLVVLDHKGGVLRPAILWNDGRAFAECEQMRSAIGKETLIKVTGNDAFAGFTAPKLLWVRKHESQVYDRTHQILLPKDYVRYRLTGSYATDKAGAGGTLLLDLASRDWADSLLKDLNIPRGWLSTTHEGPAITGTVTASAASLTGLREGTPVVAGGGDQAAQAVGVGAVDSGTWALTLGTSGVVFAPCDAPRVDPQGRAHAFPHAVPGMWHMMGVMLSAAGSLSWLCKVLGPAVELEQLLVEAAAITPGCEGLIFLPYLTGERTPHNDPHAQGAFVGLTSRHTRGHMTRAVLEGVAFGLFDSLKVHQDAGFTVPANIRISGGGARSPLWRQIIADVLRVPILAVKNTEGAATGAAILAGIGVGLWADIGDACRRVVRLGSEARVGEPAYDKAYGRFRELYSRLGPYFSSGSGSAP